jgi:F-type H+-transporting ATPase subunit a
MNVLEHLHQTTILPLHLWGVDLAITDGVITLWLAVGATMLFFFLASRRPRLVPTGLQNLAEMIVVFVRDQIAEQISDDRERWLPFLVAVFSFILVNNFIGLVPGVHGVTANINATAALALIVFLVVQFGGVRKHGLFSYLRSLVPSHLPLPITIFMVPVELVSQLAKPFSLALRLFANMLAGHAVMLLVISLIFTFKSYLIIPLPVLGNTAILMFEIFIGFIQAFVFTYLAAMYIETAQEGH